MKWIWGTALAVFLLITAIVFKLPAQTVYGTTITSLTNLAQAISFDTTHGISWSGTALYGGGGTVFATTGAFNTTANGNYSGAGFTCCSNNGHMSMGYYITDTYSLTSGGDYCWSSGAVSNTCDTFFSRGGVNTVTLGSAHGATDGTLTLTNAQTKAVAVGSLPTCNGTNEGMRASVNNSNATSFTSGIGAIVAAGGTTHVPVVCDGTNWRIG